MNDSPNFSKYPPPEKDKFLRSNAVFKLSNQTNESNTNPQNY